MRILLLSDCNTSHTIKWAISLSENKLDVIVFSLNSLKVKDYDNTNVKVITIGSKISREELINKFHYIKALPKLKSIIKQTKPDILHAHYATSYGFLGALANFNPFIISVWGSDIFEFPRKSFFHKQIVKFNLKKADKVLSTSYVMADETKLYTNKQIEVTPFGIDLDTFKKEVRKKNNSKDIIIGTIKTLEKKYGIEYLIKSFEILINKYPELSLKLLLVGGGSLDNYLKELVKRKGLIKYVSFVGNIPFSEVPKYHNMIDIFVALSEEESFGVAVIEASSCEVPVVVSDVGGLPEVVEHGVTGFIVPSKNVIKAAEAMEKLIINSNLRISIGNAGRERVKRLYNWKDNVEQMINIYKKMII